MTTPAAAAPGSGNDDRDSLADPAIVDTGITLAFDEDAGHDASNDGVVLTLSDVPSDLAQLGVTCTDFDRLAQPQQHDSAAHSHSRDPPKSSPSQQQQQQQLQHPQNPQSQPQPQQQQQLQLSASNSPTSTPVHRVRKPSPGLAARLKALGFGTTRKSSPPPSHHLEPGRLPEEALRRLEQEYLASSTQTVVERRGRPWKGAIARIPSFSSLKSDKSSKSQARTEFDEPAPEAAIAPEKPEFLPEIAASEPLEMDTNKYRLPDHTNGNGVKAQPETRDDHIARDTRPPQTPGTPEIPPPPLPKDSPPLTRRATNPTTPTARDPFDPDSITFNPLGLQRPGSIYTLSRASFANQLAQLTSLQLPDADSLSNKVSAIPTAQAATRALIGAAEQIRGWIYKASEVVGGLESDDDVEWAAAGGREGIEDVENAILRFEELIKVYVGAIEDMQSREDISSVPADDLRKAVAQMEAILEEWAKMRNALHNVKAQVEIAMEWEELWNMVLGDIQNEMDELIRLVFEMEERRHKSTLSVPTGDSMDAGELETFADDTPRAPVRLQTANNRFSMPVFPVSPTSPSPNATGISQDDSSLLALFARMQPLRASLDFLPMRLSVFEARADNIFPTACEELEARRYELDASYKKLEKDAESLRKELGEDRWVLKMLREAMDTGMHLTNQPAKKTHYGPAIERVLAIIDKGVKDRLTAKWEELKEAMADMDASQLRDSVSSMLSNDISPPSSVIMSQRRRQSSLPTPKTQVSRKPVAARMSTLSVPSRDSSATPTANRLPRPSSSLATRPKWNSSTNTKDIDTGHNFKPLTLTTPSPYSKRSPTPLPTLRTPNSRATSASPIPEATPSRNGLLSFRERLASPVPPSSNQRSISRPRLTTQPSAPPVLSSNNNRRASLQPPKPLDFSRPDATNTTTATPRRPASSLATSRRTSLLPQPRTGSVITGRESPQAVAGARFAMRKGSSSSASGAPGAKDAKPRWRM
ncbi:hypothetical protein P885DRAFT_66824 [Corynascus similis CBS 632.67]